MNMYITGILGMLGYGVSKSLSGKVNIRGIDVIDMHRADVVYNNISLFNIQAVKKDIEANPPDVVIHTAAMVSVDKCEEDKEAALRLNYQCTKDLADVCHQIGVKLVYISTDAVFDGENSRLYTEEDKTAPVNFYGKTKLMGEQAVLEYSDNLVLRTNIYGVNIQNKHSFGEWIYYSLKNGQTLNMFTDIDFSPILVSELAEVIYLACEKDLRGMYHACGTGSITKYEFGKVLQREFGMVTGKINPVLSESANLKAKRSKHMGMSNDKILKKLGIHISTPEEGIRKFYDLMKEEGLL